ncbi:hypothetical protein KM043_013870 [Ampulex compressa]|nr:hypothetical protein KM043_013870 [Ampulex compressa]
MLKHILTGQPSSSTVSRHNDLQLPDQQAKRSADVYDTVKIHQSTCSPQNRLDQSQLSVNNLSHRLNLSTLSTSKHSVNSVSPVALQNSLSHVHQSSSNGGLDISRQVRNQSRATPSPNNNRTVHLPSWSSSLSRNHKEIGAKETLTSLGLLCLVSLLLALLSLIFLLKISPLTVTSSTLIGPEEYTIVYEVTLALCALALSLNLCCLLVCAIQFLFTVKLVKTSYRGHWSNKYLQKSSVSRVCAVGGFFISIPVFLTGMILYTFIQFHSTPAIVTSVFIGLGIVFCGCAMVHNVFVWQREKTNAVKALAREQCEAAAQVHRNLHHRTLSHQHHINQNACALPRHHRTPHFHSLQQQYEHPAQAHHQLQRHVSPSLHLPPRATPPATPGDSPGSKPHRTQQLLLPSQQQLLSGREAAGSVSPGLPAATLDLSSAANTNSPHELSTLV